MQAFSVSFAPSKPSRFSGMLDFSSPQLSLGGHRGLGANVWDSTGPDGKAALFRENTIASFLAAVQAGASFIEFDVQLTKDGVPVIFHDNFLHFGDETAPLSSMVKELSLSDFKSLAPINSSSDLTSLAGASDEDTMSTARMPLEGASPLGGSPVIGGSPLGGSPLGGSPREGNLSFRLLRKHDHEVPALPLEPSLKAWEVLEEDHFPTLEEVFSYVPSHVGFDIEIKMTTPPDQPVTPPDEVSRIVDATLDAVEKAERNSVISNSFFCRPVMFSSFDPEVCTAIKRRKPDAVVMFLTGGGVYPHVDPRRTSVLRAIEFAASNGLQGIIVESLVLKKSQEIVASAAGRGLVVMTYGLENNNIDWVRQQEKIGVSGVIVDHVAEVASGLRTSTIASQFSW